ncbi:hypothetical protein EB796_020114 [Bugula neritina]|uniref:Uncharacterized protein n=1 Tax=Bugula neritina TaxID=10212 RepID=A0A7J7J5X9_BUGNE|nr:hypothetical protein EB796_020114 [Bugula neritina]
MRNLPYGVVLKMADYVQEVEEGKNCFVSKRDKLVTPAHEWVELELVYSVKAQLYSNLHRHEYAKLHRSYKYDCSKTAEKLWITPGSVLKKALHSRTFYHFSGNNSTKESTYLAADHSYTLASKAVPPPPRGTYGDEEAGILTTAEPYWQNLFETKSITDNRHPEVQQVRNELLLPITAAEVKEVLGKKSKGSPGFDGYTWKELKRINMLLLVSCCNLWLLSGMTPTGMTKEITTLIPKVIGTTNPGEFRPITVTSTFSRLYHCILGERFSNILPSNDR